MSELRGFTPEEKAMSGAGSSLAADELQPPVDPELIRSQVVRILASPEFEKSLQLGDFLEFVVEETLAGREDQIKQYTVAVKAFGRPSHFDPRADPIVRIEARRLRRSLARYYQLYGAADPIIIDIPTGAYVPRFQRNEQTTPSADEASPLAQGSPHAAIPTLALLPFETLPSDEEQRFFADSLAEELAIALHRFHHLHVVGPTPRASTTADAVDPRATARRYHADFVFGGRLLKAGDRVKIVARLMDGQTGKLLWSETYNSQSGDDPFELGEEVVHSIAATLLDTYGVIPRIFFRRMAHLQDRSFRVYQAILQYSRYMITGTGQAANAAIQVLEDAVAIAPNHVMVKALLADLYFQMYQGGGDSVLLSQGESLAREALRLDPKCQMAHFVIAFIPYFHGQRELFIRQIREAIRLNPHNPLVLATAGIHLGTLGEWEEGFALLQKAMKLNPNFPGWYHGLAFLDAYRRGHFEEALILARKFNNPTFFWDPLNRAATLGQLGQRKEAQAALEELLSLRPDFPIHGRELMTRVLFTDELVDMLLEGLHKAGLDEVV